MKKRIISLIAFLTLLLGPLMTSAKAQVFLDQEEMEYHVRLGNNNCEEFPYVPVLDVTYDQYAPLGGELLVLGCLGGAYLLSKKRQKNQ